MTYASHSIVQRSGKGKNARQKSLFICPVRQPTYSFHSKCLCSSSELRMLQASVCGWACGTLEPLSSPYHIKIFSNTTSAGLTHIFPYVIMAKCNVSECEWLLAALPLASVMGCCVCVCPSFIRDWIRLYAYLPHSVCVCVCDVMWREQNAPTIHNCLDKWSLYYSMCATELALIVWWRMLSLQIIILFFHKFTNIANSTVAHTHTHSG